MATSVTVPGVGGTSQTIVFQSSRAGGIANTLGQAIQTLITKGGLAVGEAGSSTPLPALPTAPGAAAVGVYLVNGQTPVTPPNDYSVIVNEGTTPAVINAAPGTGTPFSIIGGSGRTTFYSGTTSVGGSIYLGGGTNVIQATSTGGGINGNWKIFTGNAAQDSIGGTVAGATTVRLGGGNDTVDIGGSDTVYAGSGNSIIFVSNAATTSNVFIGSGQTTVIGNQSAGLNIMPTADSTGTGGGFFILGSGGNGKVQAAGGNSTLYAGGGNDSLYAATTAGSTNLLDARGGANVLETASLEGGVSQIWGGSNTVAGSVNTLIGGAGDDTIIAGGGMDSIVVGTGKQQVWFAKSYTNGASDVVSNFNIANDQLIIAGYGASGAPTVTSATGATLVLQLSDNTKITFSNLRSEQYASINKSIS